ncbi:MAG: phosphotransferase [Gammaproteobacteria bacterium]|nr:phosphotransferase [Gammaproteobacteria bacterium]
MLNVQHSIVSPDALLKVIQKNYPSIGASRCELLELGCNDNYRIKGKRKDLAFRLCRLNWWQPEEFDEELRYLEIMRRKKLNVCKPVRSSKKQRYIKLSAPEGIRYGALFYFIPGRHLGFNFGARNQNLVQLGDMTASMHSIADDIKQPIQRWTIGFDNAVKEFLDKAPIVLGHREKDLNYLHKIASQLEEVIFGLPDNALDFGLCHGDFHLHNIMLQPDGQLSIFDFDWCGYSWRIYDLATIWWSLTRKENTDKAWKAFLRGYSRQRRLSKYEKDLLPWFVVFRHFEFLNFQLSMRPHIGSAWLSDNYYDFHLKFFKDWIDKQLNP